MKILSTKSITYAISLAVGVASLQAFAFDTDAINKDDKIHRWKQNLKN